MLLPAETDAISEEGCCKQDAVRTFCSGGGKMIFALLTKIIAGHVIISLIYVRETCFEKTLLGTFYSRKFGFHHCLHNVLHFRIQIDPWQGCGAGRGCCGSVGRPSPNCQYVGRPRRCLSTGKFMCAFKKWRWPRRGRAGGLRDTTLNLTRASVSSGSHRNGKILEGY